MDGIEMVYVISDSVGETAEFVVKAVATQFNGGQVEIRRNSFVRNEEDIDEIINMAKQHSSLIAYTLVIPDLKEHLDRRAEEENVVAIDLLYPLMNAFEEKFHKTANHRSGLTRQLNEDYFRKVEAVEFAVKYDDGKDPRGLLYADIVLIGVSRTSKTPLSMYLAHKGYKVANVPLVPEVSPPDELYKIKRSKCCLLYTSPSPRD